MKRAEAKHLSRVADLGCLLCEARGIHNTPAEIHHIRMGQGMQQRSEHWLTVPLCPEHHRGPHGIHGDRQAFKLAKVDELDLLAVVIERLSDA